MMNHMFIVSFYIGPRFVDKSLPETLVVGKNFTSFGHIVRIISLMIRLFLFYLVLKMVQFNKPLSLATQLVYLIQGPL